MRLKAECPVCSEVTTVDFDHPALSVNDTETFGCEHAKRFSNGTILFSTVLFIDEKDKWHIIPMEPEGQ